LELGLEPKLRFWFFQKTGIRILIFKESDPKSFGKKVLKFGARTYDVYNGISKAWNFEFHSNAFCFSGNLKIQNSNISVNIPPKKCKGSCACVLSIGEESENIPF
jgi:hypothetical protein